MENPGFDMIDKIPTQTDEHYAATMVFGIAFVLLLLMNLQVLTDPPYWDALTGIYSQAVWLKDHNFDYFQLWHQPKWVDGGPHVKILYVLAPVYALLIKFLGAGWAFTSIHIFNIFCAALTFTLFYVFLRDHMPDKLALLWCSAAALDPIWSGQVASLYIEIPQAACYGATILALHRRRYLLAALFCLVAFLVKSSALLLALAMLIWFIGYRLGLHFTVDYNNTHKKIWPDAYVAAPFPVLFWLANQMNADNFKLQWNLSDIFYSVKILLPFQTGILVLTGFILAVTLIRWKLWGTDYWYNDRFLIVSFLTILTGGFWAAYHLYPLPLCRYAASVVFPMIALLGLLVTRWSYRMAVLLACLLIIIGAANQYGLLLPSLPTPVARSGEHLERSREYLLDLTSNQRVCRFLEKNYFDHPIVVKYPFAHMLSSSDLGYVRKPLPDIHVAGRRPTFTQTRQFEPGKETKKPPLHVYTPNVFEHYTVPTFVPDPKSEIVYTDIALGAATIVYRPPGK